MSSALATQPEPAPVARVSPPRLTDNALLAGAAAVLLLAPLAFGAVEPWSIFALEASAMLLLAVWASRQWINRELNISGHALYRPMAAFFVLVLAQWAWTYLRHERGARLITGELPECLPQGTARTAE